MSLYTPLRDDDNTTLKIYIQKGIEDRIIYRIMLEYYYNLIREKLILAYFVITILQNNHTLVFSLL